MEAKQLSNNTEASDKQPLYRAWLCGPFRVEKRLGETYVACELGDSLQTLFKALLCGTNRRMSRSALLAQLWPEADGEKAAGFLNTAVSRLRRAIPEVFATEPDALGFSLPEQSILWVDSDAFLDLLAKAERLDPPGENRENQQPPSPDIQPLLEQALAYFQRGLFLEPDDGEWTDEKRALVEHGRYRSRLRLADLYRQQGFLGPAEKLLNELWGEDPTDEDVLRSFMQLFHRHGLTHHALVLYRKTRALAAKEGRKLTDATRMLAVRLQKDQSFVVQWNQVSQLELSEVGQGASAPLLLLPEEVPVRPLQPSPANTGISVDMTTWFAIRVNSLKALGSFWQGYALSYQQQQALIHAEIETWNTMTEQDQLPIPEYLLTRRMALATLATLSTSLLTKVQSDSLNTVVVEEFLSQCATSLTACSHLLQGDGLTTVEYTLPRYLPPLIALAKSPSAFQKRAAHLASQGCFLLGLVKLHRLQFREQITCWQQSVEFARVAENQTIFATALTHLGDAWLNSAQPEKTLQTYQEAASLLDKAQDPGNIPFLLQSRIHLGLARAHARLSQQQEATSRLHRGNEAFSQSTDDDFLALSLDYDLPLKILFEGSVHLDLGQLKEEKGSSKLSPYEAANTALAQVEQISPSVLMAERIRLEILNQRALVAVKSKDMEHFINYLTEGIQGAKALGSEKRRAEALANWKAARKQWPKELRVLELADLFL
jgi:DNA-binding SARP family transcriptional activator